MFSKRNVSNKLRLTILLVLSAGIILSFAPGALAQPELEIWSGPLTVQVKATEFIPETGKFKTKSQPLSGRLEVYTEVDGPPTPNGDGDYMKFIGDDQLTTMRIKQLVMIEMQVNATTGKFLAVGTGVFHDPNAPDSNNQDGIVYVDFSGSVKKPANKPTTVSLVIKMGGGINGDVVFSANPKATLTKQLEP